MSFGFVAIVVSVVVAVTNRGDCHHVFSLLASYLFLGSLASCDQRHFWLVNGEREERRIYKNIGAFAFLLFHLRPLGAAPLLGEGRRLY